MNGGRVMERRIQLGLSRTDLARLTGLSWDGIASIETRGEPAGFTLAAARRLASALAITLSPLASHTREPADDDIRIEALLPHADQPLSLTDIARALKWPLARTHQGLKRLDQRLANTGQTVRLSAPGSYELAARGDVLKPAELAALRRHEEQIQPHEARLLHSLIIGRDRHRLWEDFDPEQRSTLARLAQRGLATPAGSWVGITEDARYNLQPEFRRNGLLRVEWPLPDARAAG